MFSKLSRYRSVPDIAVLDARGRVVAAKDSRPLPLVTGAFTHTVDSGDRLDRLANTYYGQPLLYWRILDADPDVLSPLAVLDQEPVVTTRFPLTAPAGGPPWAALLATLASTVGVEDVTVVEEDTARAVLVTYNRLNVAAWQLGDAIATTGFVAGQPAGTGQLGRQLVIPPVRG